MNEPQRYVRVLSDVNDRARLDPYVTALQGFYSRTTGFPHPTLDDARREGSPPSFGDFEFWLLPTLEDVNVDELWCTPDWHELLRSRYDDPKCVQVLRERLEEFSHCRIQQLAVHVPLDGPIMNIGQGLSPPQLPDYASKLAIEWYPPRETAFMVEWLTSGRVHRVFAGTRETAFAMGEGLWGLKRSDWTLVDQESSATPAPK